MLSKKMTFSLMYLITISFLIFLASSAMAGEFGVSLDISGDVSHTDGLQLQDAATIALTVKFEQAVVLTAADVSISNYDKDGGFLAPSANAPMIAPTIAAKEFTITIVPADDATRLVVRTKKGIASADPFNEDMSEEGKWSIDLLAENPVAGPDVPANPAGGPDVLKIALVGEPFETITTATFQIHVLLSEEPKDGFNQELLEVTNATVRSFVKLASPGSSTTVNGTTVRASWRDNQLHLYLVTLETQPDEKTVEIKVKNFAGKETPTGALNQETYVRAADNALTEGRDKLTVKTNRNTPITRIITITVKLPENTTIPAHEDVANTDEKGTADETSAIKVTDTSVTIPEAGRIYISEIMFADGGFLPQWIEISNGSRTEQVNLSGWTLKVENATADTNVFVKAKAKFRIPQGTRINPSGQHDTPSTLLVVAKQGRTNLDGKMAENQIVNLDISRRRHALLSDTAFKITLAPPAGLEIVDGATATDVVGNLSDDGIAAWALPMSESGPRNSMIRRHVSAEPTDGEMMDSWVLASARHLPKPMRLGEYSYYGFPTDIGTPGFRPGGAVPVELSHFRPVRDKETGTVMITWSTQSELNNAGFFIKRSNQKNGEFKVINATMVPGAGTTSEKQFYTYTDATAQPNIVYYYQIEDVSLDGNRQTLTNGIRLKGHIGAAGKLTSTWGEIKASNE